MSFLWNYFDTIPCSIRVGKSASGWIMFKTSEAKYLSKLTSIQFSSVIKFVAEAKHLND